MVGRLMNSFATVVAIGIDGRFLPSLLPIDTQCDTTTRFSLGRGLRFFFYHRHATPLQFLLVLAMARDSVDGRTIWVPPDPPLAVLSGP